MCVKILFITKNALLTYENKELVRIVKRQKLLKNYRKVVFS
jgi:hypothetical protein